MTSSESIYRRFEMLKRVPEDLQARNADEGPYAIDVPSATLSRIVDWCRNHPGMPIPAASPSIRTAPRQRQYLSVFSETDEPPIEIDPCTGERRIGVPTTPWESDFFATMPFRELYRLLNACHYLEIQHLYVYACQAVAVCIKGESSPEGVRRMLNSTSAGHSKRGRRRMRENNPWTGDGDDQMARP